MLIFLMIVMVLSAVVFYQTMKIEKDRITVSMDMFRDFVCKQLGVTYFQRGDNVTYRMGNRFIKRIAIIDAEERMIKKILFISAMVFIIAAGITIYIGIM